MDVKILGPLQIIDDGRIMDLGRPRQQTVLALLLLAEGRVVSVGRLLEALYDSEPPPTARAQIQICISAIRKMFADRGCGKLISTEAQGYVLHHTSYQSDARQFTELAAQGRELARSGMLEDAVRMHRTALSHWRGSALEGIESRVVQAAAAKLNEQRITVNEECIELELELGHHREVVGELTELIEQHPLRERLRSQLMTALSRSGRRAEALAVYQRAREAMIEELGLEPDQELQRLQQAILASDETVAVASAQPAEPSRETVERATVPRLLPTDVADFTGRDDEVNTLTRILLANRHQLAVPVVVVSGKPGVGKTAIAVHTAHAVKPDFPDGQLYADLHGTAFQSVHARQVLERFLRVLGVPAAEIADSLEERAEMYRAMLAERRVLVVLDDVGSESEALPLIPGYPGCAVIITSRSTLPGLPGSVSVEVDTFQPEQSVEFLTHIAGAGRIRAEPEAAAQLAQMCGHLPLALRIAGARLAARPNRRVALHVQRLTGDARRLDELRYGEMGIRTTLMLSYQGLSESAKRLFRRLALSNFRHHSDWEAAALLDLPVAEAEDLLGDLVEARLVELSSTADPEPARYRLHELTRLFARERAIAEEPAEARKAALTRVFGALLFLAQKAHGLEYGGDYAQVHSGAPRRPVPDDEVEEIFQQSPLDWLERERTTLVAAIDQAARMGAVDLCWDLAITSVTLFEARIYYDDWRHTHEIALDAARRAGDSHGQAAMLYSLGSLHSAEQRFDDAKRCLEAAAQLFQADGNLQGEALSIRDIAYIQGVYGHLDVARQGYQRALHIFRRTGDLASAAFILHSLGRIELESGNAEEGKRTLAEGLGLSRDAGSRRVEAQVLCWLGDAHLGSGAIDKAFEAYRDSLDIVSGMHDKLGETYALRGLAAAMLARGDLDGAEATLARCRELLGTARSRLAHLRVLMTLSDLDSARGKNARALQHLQEALTLCGMIQAPLYELRVLTRLSVAHREAGDDEAAARVRSKALSLAGAMDPVLLSQVRSELVGTRRR